MQIHAACDYALVLEVARRGNSFPLRSLPDVSYQSKGVAYAVKESLTVRDITSNLGKVTTMSPRVGHLSMELECRLLRNWLLCHR